MKNRLLWILICTLVYLALLFIRYLHGFELAVLSGIAWVITDCAVPL
jgi:hypothetical protein